MKKDGCAYSGKSCRVLDAKCEGCDRTFPYDDKMYCAVFPDPVVKWRLGNCNMATHIKVESKDASKVRVGQQKQKKK
jgi:hypothetical protein